MLTSMSLLKDYGIAATDGDIGKVCDALFDDQAWDIRFLTVETGSWLESRQVLIPPSAFDELDAVHKTLPVRLSREQVRHSPDTDVHKSVSRQHATQFADPADPHLRSCKAVNGYQVQASDGELGYVSDFLIEEDSWVIRYLVVNTGNWLSGNQVLVPPQWASAISWDDRSVSVDLTRATIEAAPRFFSCHALNRQQELDYYRYHARPDYWSHI